VLSSSKQEVDWSRVQEEYDALLENEETKEGGEAVRFDSVVGSASEELEAKISAYARRLGTTIASSPGGHVFINGKYYTLNNVSSTTLDTNVKPYEAGIELLEFTAVGDRTGTSVFPREGEFTAQFLLIWPTLSHGYFAQVYTGAITDDDADDIKNHFFDLPTTMKRRNRHVIPSGNGASVRVINLPRLHQETGLRTSAASFIYPSKMATYFSFFFSPTAL
jgi:UDP-glucose:glycoprotein glucosyltransferase